VAVSRDDFKGYWMYRELDMQPKDPMNCDSVLLYIHGGGYVLGHPADQLTEILAMAETFETRQTSIAIFSLDYTLAPEARFPVQVEEALSSYRYIVQELEVDPSKIILMGESAGGHLALSLLITLRRDAAKGSSTLPGDGLPRPATVVLNSP
jgi:acetyl esterase/lipase